MSARRGAGMPARSAAVNFDGSINTGLTIRTIRMKDGLAEVRVGATCLFDSDPAAEDRECQVKAAALFQALRGDPPKPLSAFAPDATGSGKNVLLIDHDDSFVHMLADYFRQVGASVTVVRHVHAQEMLKKKAGTCWCCRRARAGRRISGSRRPSAPRSTGSCRSSASASACRRSANISAASSASSPSPRMAGRRASRCAADRLMQNLPNEIVIGRYHSLYVERDSVPDVLDGHRDHRGRRRDGDRAQDPAGRRRAVPPGIADVARRRGGPAHRRKCIPAERDQSIRGLRERKYR